MISYPFYDAYALDTTSLKKRNYQTNIIDNGSNVKKCVMYDDKSTTITVSCKPYPVSLTDIYDQIHNPKVLEKQPNGVWLLNTNLTIQKGSVVVIDPKDTKWLKILTDGKTLAYGVHVYGGLRMDSVKVTSWNLNTNYYAFSNGSRESPDTKIVHIGAPRPYIIIERGATGTTNITNSEVAYLGSELGWGSGKWGLNYRAGNGSIIKNNQIHHFYFGFYSNGVSRITIENNVWHDNNQYGIDPHTGSNNLVIRNNTVFNTNGPAIICSLDCYNILIENNKVYNNTGPGIMFSRNMYNSIARNNYIQNQDRAIVLSESHDNEVHSNNIKNVNRAINLIGNSSANRIYNNMVANSTSALSIRTGAHDNTFYSNMIVNNAVNDSIKKPTILIDNKTADPKANKIFNNTIIS